MVERRSLMDGVRTKPTPEEEAFLKGTPVPKPSSETSSLTPPASSNGATIALSTRIRSDLYTALKRATLQRKLAGQTPDTAKEILEELLEPWLQSNGYLPQ